LPIFLHFQSTEVSSLCWNTFPVRGSVINFNTFEAFKTFDKVKYLDEVEGRAMWEAIQSGEVAKSPNMLNKFVLLMFADLKKYQFYYW
jgi:ubiquitin-like modifier-activating enzyme ATG7